MCLHKETQLVYAWKGGLVDIGSSNAMVYGIRYSFSCIRYTVYGTVKKLSHLEDSSLDLFFIFYSSPPWRIFQRMKSRCQCCQVDRSIVRSGIDHSIIDGSAYGCCLTCSETKIWMESDEKEVWRYKFHSEAISDSQTHSCSEAINVCSPDEKPAKISCQCW